MESVKELLSSSQALMFVNFTKTPVTGLSSLRATLAQSGGILRVIKKRLLTLALKAKNVEIDAKQFEGQVAAVFSPREISDGAGTLFRFAKEGEKKGFGFSLLGGYDIISGKFFGKEDILRIGQLPSREILLAQVAMVLSMPARSLAYVLSKVGEKKGGGDGNG